MSALAHQPIENRQSVTSISVNARIDYILRFSQQAVLVLGEDANTYSQIGSLLLGALPDDHNAAFVSMSAKLNDIQIRSRLTEQLFSGALFDPEQSLTKGIIKLATEKRETISIIVEHAHLLSLQLLHELCQLAEIAKKTKLSINVVMLGQTQAGKLVANNKSLFNNKLSILSAKTGQLLAIDASLFQEKYAFFTLTFAKKALIGFCILLLISTLVITWLYQRDSLSFSALPEQNNDNSGLAADVFVGEVESTLSADTSSGATQGAVAITSALSSPSITQNDTSSSNSPATTDDIYLALLASATDSSALSDDNVVNLQAKPADVFNAVIANKSEVNDVIFDREKVLAVTQIIPDISLTAQAKFTKTKVQSSDTAASGIDPQYYLKAQQGFVIQLGGFSYPSVFEEFISEHSLLEYYGYYRQLNQQQLLVVTSRIYGSRDEPDQAKAKLPELIKQRGPWIKTVSTINNEINTFQSSQ